MATLGDLNIFQIARNEVEKEISSFIERLNRKKTELIVEITSLETEHNKARTQKQNDVRKLKDLKSQTENLNQNNLVGIQHKLLEEIDSGINKLKFECDAPPDFQINIVWGNFREKCKSLLTIPKVTQVINVLDDDEVANNGGSHQSSGDDIGGDIEREEFYGRRRDFYDYEDRAYRSQRTFSRGRGDYSEYYNQSYYRNSSQRPPRSSGHYQRGRPPGRRNKRPPYPRRPNTSENYP